MATKKAETPLIYVTRDIERALGIEPSDPYFVLTNRTPYSETIARKYPGNVFLVDGRTADGELLDTFDLLKAGEKHIPANAEILVFKNTSRIEEFCAEKKWVLLNPKAALAEQIENKITQVAWLGDGKKGAEKYLPPHAIKKVSEIMLKNNKNSNAADTSEVSAPFMLQWAHGHTGDGTVFISAGKSGEKILAALREKFPDREARITSYIQGPVFTANIIVSSDKIKKTGSHILVGNISNQITGTLPFTDNPWSTVGNDWSVPHSIMSEEKIAQFHEIAQTVGERMRESGWLGLFGIDCIYDAERENLHLIEVNARQPASATFESQLQNAVRAAAPKHFENSYSVFGAHIATLKKIKIGGDDGLIEINDGAQIILRIPSIKEMRKTVQEIAEISDKLQTQKYTVIEYENAKIGQDRIRIQSDRGIMESNNKFNSRGKEILGIVNGNEGMDENEEGEEN